MIISEEQTEALTQLLETEKETALRKENKRLRAALGKITRRREGNVLYTPQFTNRQMFGIARAALRGD